MGCPECAEAAVEGGEVQGICQEATTEAQCREANPGADATFGSGSIPAELLNAGGEESGRVGGSHLAACMSYVSVLLVVVVAGIFAQLAE